MLIDIIVDNKFAGKVVYERGSFDDAAHSITEALTAWRKTNYPLHCLIDFVMDHTGFSHFDDNPDYVLNL